MNIDRIPSIWRVLRLPNEPAHPSGPASACARLVIRPLWHAYWNGLGVALNRSPPTRRTICGQIASRDRLTRVRSVFWLWILDPDLTVDVCWPDYLKSASPVNTPILVLCPRWLTRYASFLCFANLGIFSRNYLNTIYVVC